MVVLGFLVGTHLYGKLGDRYAVDREAEAPSFAAVPMWILVGSCSEPGPCTSWSRSSGAAPPDSATSMTRCDLLLLGGRPRVHGGTFGGIALGLYAARKRRLHLPRPGPRVAAGFCGLAVGRVGCLLVGDFGKSCPRIGEPAVPPDDPGPQPARGQPLRRGERRPGALGHPAVDEHQCARPRPVRDVDDPPSAVRRPVTLVLLVLYSIGRFTIEGFRGDKIRGLWFDGCSPPPSSCPWSSDPCPDPAPNSIKRREPAPVDNFAASA